MTLEEQLKAEILSKYKSIRAFTQQFGISYSTLDSIFKRGIKNAGIDTILKIFGALNIDIESVKTGSLKRATPLPVDNFYTVDEQSLINKYRTLDAFGQDTVKAVLDCESKRCLSQKEMNDLLSDYNIIYLPMPIQSASAGTGEVADDETVERVPVLRNVWTSKADYALRVHGDSMEPDMHDGDLLLVRSQPAIEPGEIGIFIHQGERFVKVFREDRLESLNNKYEDINIEEDTKCIGKVIGVLNPEWFAK